VKLLIPDNAWVYLEGVSPQTEKAISEALSAEHPNSRYMNIIDAGQQSWDGVYRKYNSKQQKFPRTFLPDVEILLSKRKIPYVIEDLRPESNFEPPSIIDPGLLPGITLEDYQLRSIKAAMENEFGILKLPTGAGKTEVMCAIIKLFGRSAVVIADIRVVIEQIKERLDLRDVAGDDGVGLFYGGATPTGQKVIVGSIQSLSTPPASLRRKKPAAYKSRLKKARIFQEITKRTNLLLVDECDKAGSKPYRNLFRHHFKGRYKYGFSATPFDPDKPVDNLIVKENLGSVIVEVPRFEVQAAGRIIPVKFYMIAVGEDGNKKDSRAFDIAEREEIIDNTEFHKRVKTIVDAFSDEGTMILVDTTNVEDLGKSLEGTIPDSKFIYGKTTKKRRTEAIRAFESREMKCLIGGKIVKRGLDLKGGAENLIIIGGGKLWSNFDQMIGRAVRKNKRGFSRVFSFYFLNNKYLYSHSRKQLKALVEMGYESTVVFKDARISGEALIKRRFRRPKPQK
jgi:superfamily II DNA or RNA helicase